MITDYGNLLQLNIDNLDIPILMFSGKNVIELEKKYPYALILTELLSTGSDEEFNYVNPLENIHQLFPALDKSINLLIDQEKGVWHFTIDELLPGLATNVGEGAKSPKRKEALTMLK